MLVKSTECWPQKGPRRNGRVEMVAPKSRGPIYKAQLQFFENFSNGILSAPYGLKVMVFCYSLAFQLLNV